jgi:hypothetical protein
MKLGSLQAGWHIYLHRYAASPDRWVFQPFVIFDRTAV